MTLQRCRKCARTIRRPNRYGYCTVRHACKQAYQEAYERDRQARDTSSVTSPPGSRPRAVVHGFNVALRDILTDLHDYSGRALQALDALDRQMIDRKSGTPSAEEGGG